MRRSFKRWLLCAAVVCALGCSTAPLAPQRPVAKTSPLAKVREGMTFTQVVEVLGPPTAQSRQLTGHAFNPFAVGNEGQITRFHYLKLGRVVFAGPDLRGQGAAVIAIEEDAAEPGHE
jgi:hypothetical protein